MSDIEVELHVPSFDAIEEFYGALGFAFAPPDTRTDPGYMVASLGNSAIRFYRREGPHEYFGDTDDDRLGVGVEVVVNVEDLDAAFTAAESLGAIVAPMKARPWGLRDFRVADPFGYYLRFTEPQRASHA